ncbi:hypothetical protein RB595_010674 [Gaeumannomyces hyphopodioides]
MAATIKLYTNYGCPFAHRIHIALAELGLPFEEVAIDLSNKPADFLAVNPAGLVPALVYGEHIITESAVIAQFLVDAQPAGSVKTPLLPPPGTPEAALARARVALFADAWMTKLFPLFARALVAAKTLDEATAAGAELNDGITTHLEPLLAGAAPFFGGSQTLTMAEVLIAPFAIRLFTLSRAGVIPASTSDGLEGKAPNFYRWATAVVEHPSVRTVWEKGNGVEVTRERVVPMRGW